MPRMPITGPDHAHVSRGQRDADSAQALLSEGASVYDNGEDSSVTPNPVPSPLVRVVEEEK